MLLPQLREMLDHPDRDVQEQGAELCLSLGTVQVTALLAAQQVEGWLCLGPSGRHLSWLRLLLHADADLRSQPLRLSLAAMPDADALLPALADRLPGLVALDLSHTDVSDLSVLARLPHLETLWLRNCSQLVPDSLLGLTALRRLDATRAPAALATHLPAGLTDLCVDWVALPAGWTPPPKVQSLSCRGGAVQLRLHAHPLVLLRLGSLGQLASRPPALPLQLSVGYMQADPQWLDAAITVLSLSGADLKDPAVLERFPQLEVLRIRLWDEETFSYGVLHGCSSLRELELMHPSSEHSIHIAGEWPTGLRVSAPMIRLRKRNQIPALAEAIWAQSAADHRAAGRRWCLETSPEVREETSQRRIQGIRSIRTLTGEGLRESKDLSDQVLDDTLVCRTLERALRDQGLLWAAGVGPVYLAPWTGGAGA